MSHWLVVGISGVTNGGKSSLTTKLMSSLPKSTKCVNQDDYFYPEDCPHHVMAPGGLSHYNWDVVSSIDMDRMITDVLEMVNLKPQLSAGKYDSIESKTSPLPISPNDIPCTTEKLASMCRPILLLDGFLLFDDPRITELCSLKYFFTLTREQCWERRQQRVYDPPDPPGYFEHCVWPMYEAHLSNVKKNVEGVVFLNGMMDHFQTVYQEIVAASKATY